MDRIEVKLAADDVNATTGTFSGFGAVFDNVDSHGDTIKRGAFRQSLKEWKARGRMPAMLLQHGIGFDSVASLSVGQWTDMREEDEGLRVEGKLFALQTELGQLIHENLKSGQLDGLSIGYRARKYQIVDTAKDGEAYRILQDIDLREVSLVREPSNERARVDALKFRLSGIGPERFRDIEAILRDGGLSRSDAVKAVAALKRLQRDAAEPGSSPRDEDDAALAALIRRNIAIIKG